MPSLADLRKQLGLTQGDVARGAGATQPAILKVETSADPQLSTIRRYVQGLRQSSRREISLDLMITVDGELFPITFPTAREHPMQNDSSTETHWRLRAWDDHHLEQRWLQEGVIAISDDEIGDLSDWPGDDALRQRLEDAFARRNDTRGEQAYGTFVRYWRAFRLDMSPGDLVAVPLVNKRVGIAEIAGDYEYRSAEIDPKMRHVRPVRWIRQTDRASLDEPLRRIVNAPGTICQIRNSRIDR